MEDAVGMTIIMLPMNYAAKRATMFVSCLWIPGHVLVLLNDSIITLLLGLVNLLLLGAVREMLITI